MATSVKLKACGGLGPYTWSVDSGNIVTLRDSVGVEVSREFPEADEVEISQEEGTFTVVVKTETCSDECEGVTDPDVIAYHVLEVKLSAINSPSTPCSGGSHIGEDIDFVAATHTGTAYNCAGNVVGVIHSGGCTTLAGTASLTIHLESCNGPTTTGGSSIAGGTSLDGQATVDATCTGIAGLSGGSASGVPIPGSVSETYVEIGTVDVRTQDMIDCGCEPEALA